MVIEAGKFRVTDVVGRVTEVRREDFHVRDQVGVLQAGTDAGFKVIEGLVAGDHGGQLVDVAVIDDLEEFFLRPRGGVLRAKIVHNQQWNGADLGETLLKAGVGGAAVRETQPVEQIRHGQEEGADAHAHRLVGDGCGEVRFA